MNVSYLSQMIIDRIGSLTQTGLPIQYSLEDQPLETAGGIVKARPLLQEDLVLVLNADAYCDLDFQIWANSARARMQLTGAQACLLLVENPAHNPGGDFTLTVDDRDSNDSCVFGRVSDNLGSSSSLTFSGISLLHVSLFDTYQTATGRLADILTQAMADNLVIGSRFDGLWCDVGTPQRLNELEAELVSRQ